MKQIQLSKQVVSLHPQPVNEWYQHPKWRWRNDGKIDFRRERDTQRQKAYRSERSVFQTATNHDKQEQFESLLHVQNYLDKLVTRAWFKTRWGEMCVTVCKGKANYYRGFHITLNNFGLHKWVVLHELAHACTPKATGGGHGRYWARSYIELVKFEIGEDYANQLKEAFNQNGVKYKVKKIYTPEMKAKIKENFVMNVLSAAGPEGNDDMKSM